MKNKATIEKKDLEKSIKILENIKSTLENLTISGLKDESFDGSIGELAMKNTIDTVIEFISSIIYKMPEENHTIRAMMEEIHWTSVKKGCWRGKNALASKIDLCCGKLLRVMEEYRKETDNSETGSVTVYADPAVISCELADVIILILDMAEYCKIDLEYAVREKMRQNRYLLPRSKEWEELMEKRRREHYVYKKS